MSKTNPFSNTFFFFKPNTYRAESPEEPCRVFVPEVSSFLRRAFRLNLIHPMLGGHLQTIPNREKSFAKRLDVIPNSTRPPLSPYDSKLRLVGGFVERFFLLVLALVVGA